MEEFNDIHIYKENLSPYKIVTNGKSKDLFFIP